MKSLEFVAATALVLAIGVGLYKGTESFEQKGDFANPAAGLLSGIQGMTAPVGSVDIPAESNSKHGAGPIPPTASSPHAVKPIVTRNPTALTVAPTTSVLIQGNGPVLLRERGSSQGGNSAPLSLATSNSFLGPNALMAAGDRTTSTRIIRGPNITISTLNDTAPPATSVGEVDALPPTDSFPKSSALTESVEIDLLQPTNPDPLDTARSPDTAVPEPGTVAGLLMVGVLGVGAIAKRKLARH